MYIYIRRYRDGWIDRQERGTFFQVKPSKYAELLGLLEDPTLKTSNRLTMLREFLGSGFPCMFFMRVFFMRLHLSSFTGFVSSSNNNIELENGLSMGEV